MEKKRYALVGTGGRCEMYLDAMIKIYKDTIDLVAVCDHNPGRMKFRQEYIKEESGLDVPGYHADDFDTMVKETRPDTVIVTTGPDRAHDTYICRAMELGCDVITEKPMTTDAEKARRILRTRAETGRNLQVTFNYRYSPSRTQVREMIKEGKIGDIYSVDFSWQLNTQHGADYFRRWHRHLANSGSLLVHKATHHFDLVQWWIDDHPEEVFCHGSRRYYVPATATRMGLDDRSERCATCPVSQKCPFYLDLASKEKLKKLYQDNEQFDGYYRDRCVFSSDIDIWDTMSVSVKYSQGAIMSYLLTAYNPIEGFQVVFNGNKGRIELRQNENSYISGDGTVPGVLEKGKTMLAYIPEFSKPQEIEPRMGQGGHGGGDPVLLADIFDPDAPHDPLHRKANQVDGTYSILVGVAAYTSIREHRPVKISELLGDAPLGYRWI